MIATPYSRETEGEGMFPGKSDGHSVGELEQWASLLAGGGLTAFGILRRTWGGTAAAIVGGALLVRGVSGRCAFHRSLGIRTATDRRKPVERRLARHGVKVEKTVTIRATVQEVYSFWRNFENLPQVLRHIESVEVLPNGLSHWKVKGPLGAPIEWDAEVVNDRENELIAWRTLEGSSVDHAGSVHFSQLERDPSTQVRVTLKYNPPAGSLGTAFGDLLGQDPGKDIEEDLVRLQEVFESRRLHAPLGRLPESGVFAPARVSEKRWAERPSAPPTDIGSAPPGASPSST